MKSKFFNLSKIELLLLSFIILIGALLRFQGALTNSFAYTYDVGRDMLALWNIVYLHKISLIGFTTGLPGVFYGPWWYFILLPFYLVSGGSPQGVDFLLAIWGVITVLAAYVLGKKIGGVFLGVAVSSLMAVSPFLISLSSQIWNPNIAPLFIILVLLILHKLYSEPKIKVLNFFFLGLLLALIVDLEIVFGLLFMIGVILSGIVIINKKLTLKSFFAFILGILVIFSPRIIFELRHGFIMTKSFISFFATSDGSSQLSLVGAFVDRLKIIFDQFNSTIAAGNSLVGAIVILLVVIAIGITYKNASEINKKFIRTLGIVLLTFLTGLTFFHHDIWPHYLVGLPVVYIFLFSIAMFLFAQKFKNNFFPAIIVLGVFLLNFNPLAIISNFNKPLWVGDASVYRNQLAVVDYVYTQAKGENFKYVVYTPPIYDYTYQYLFEWYGPKKYHYSSIGQANLAFFILEPDPQYPFRLTDWLKLREKDGKIIKTEKFKSGIIVQTRIH